MHAPENQFKMTEITVNPPKPPILNNKDKRKAQKSNLKPDNLFSESENFDFRKLKSTPRLDNIADYAKGISTE